MQLTSTLALLAATSNALASSIQLDNPYEHEEELKHCDYDDLFESCRELVHSNVYSKEAMYLHCIDTAVFVETEFCDGDPTCKEEIAERYKEVRNAFYCTQENDC